MKRPLALALICGGLLRPGLAHARPPLEITLLETVPRLSAADPLPRAVPAGGAGTRVANGDLLAVWPAGSRSLDLLAGFLTGAHAGEKPYRLAADADPAMTPAIQPLLDGGALVVYRQALAGGTALTTLRLHGRRWLKGGRLPAAPVSIALRVDGGRVAMAWSDRPRSAPPRIRAAFSPDAGARYLQPITVAEGAETSSPDMGLLHDAAAIVVWRDGPKLWVRRLSPEWYADPAREVPLGAAAAGAPRLNLTRDYAGASNDAEGILSVPIEGGFRRFRIGIPEADLLAAAAEDCHCAPSAAQLRGYPLRGTVVAFDPSAGLLTLDLDAVPGVMDPGLHRFRLAATERPQLRVGGDCLGRIERIDGKWEIFDLRRLGP